MNKLQNKKILYVWKAAWPWDVRIDKFCHSIAKSGGEVTLLAKYEPGQSVIENSDDFNIVRFGKNLSNYNTLPIPFNKKWYEFILQTASDIKADMIIVREIMLAKQCADVAKVLNIPVIMDMAENYPALMRLWKKYRYGIVNKILIHTLGLAEWTEKITVPRMDGIIVVCPEQISRLNDLYKYSEENISVIYNTPDLTFTKPEKNTSKHDNRIVFCHHGHLTDEKKIDKFLTTLLNYPNHQEKFKFIIAGLGESLTELKQIYSDAGSPDNIEFFGSYKYEDLGNILSTCDYGVLPYQVNDFNNYTIHNKIFDYFAFAKPVIVSQVEPLKRLATETNACLVYDFSTIDSGKQMFDDILAQNYQKLSDNAYQSFLNKYNWQNDSNMLINFLEKYL
jgi:glycosyltransferase involved in cell wall biosynthesis